MKPTTMNRLEKLEMRNGQKRSRIQCIERAGIKPGRRRGDPQFYRDGLGNFWARENGETAEEFQGRVTAEAIAKAQPKIAQILGFETLEEATHETDAD